MHILFWTLSYMFRPLLPLRENLKYGQNYCYIVWLQILSRIINEFNTLYTITKKKKHSKKMFFLK
jgi:hypothetical protein